MKTENDLRLEYKRDTGLDADKPFETEGTLDDFLDIDLEGLTKEALIEEIESAKFSYHNVTVVNICDEIPYINWLEERLLKLWTK
jgi:hypothetical protein